MGQAVVAQASAHFMEEIVALAQRVAEFGQRGNMRIGDLRQAVHPRIENVGRVNINRLVGAESREDLGRQRGGGDGLVPGEIVGGVVRGAHRLHLKLAQDPVRAQFGRGQPRVGLLPHTWSALGVQQLIDAEVALQLQMRPVIQRIAQGRRHRTGPRLEFLDRRSAAGAVAFGHSIGPHRAPFIVIAFQPDFEEVLELSVLSHVFGRQVAMIIEDGLLFGVRVVKPARGLVT
jgi:hypothetical protein